MPQPTQVSNNMKIIRWILGKIILLIDALTRPTPMTRTPEAQAEVDQQTPNYKLYQYKACPFCVKVRRELIRLNLDIETRDALNNEQYRQELIDQGGKAQVPCLRIKQQNGSEKWLYESSEINNLLRAEFG